MVCEVHRLADGAGALILCGVRESRKRCAFCPKRAAVRCDGARCVAALCDEHRWSAADELDFCPPCEAELYVDARTPKQIGLFG